MQPLLLIKSLHSSHCFSPSGDRTGVGLSNKMKKLIAFHETGDAKKMKKFQTKKKGKQQNCIYLPYVG